jgi:hypothetical protein
VIGAATLGPVIIAAILVGAPLLHLNGTCAEDMQSLPSPDGGLVALGVARGCGASGSVTSAVRVRRTDEPDVAAETVLSAGIGLNIAQPWLDSRRLVLDNPQHPDREQYVEQVEQLRGGVTIVARPQAPYAIPVE